MKWFYNLKVAAKLLIAFMVVALIAGIVGVVGIVNLLEIQALDKDMYERNTAPLDDLARIMYDYQAMRVNHRDMLLSKDVAEIDRKCVRSDELEKSINDNMVIFQGSIKDTKVQETFNSLRKTMDEYGQYRLKIEELIKAGKTDQAMSSLYGEGAKIVDAVGSSCEMLLQLKVDLAKQSAETNSATAVTAVVIMIVVILIGMVIAVILGIFISRIVANPVKKMVEAADKLALGDINVRVEATTTDEIGSLMQSFGKMVENIREQAFAVEKIAAGDLTVQVKVKSDNDLLGKKLSEMIEKNNEILTNINSASEQVAAGAGQVSASSQMLSQGSTEQASSVEEITSSMTQVAAQTKQNAVNANQANELALSAKENAVQGNSQMQEMVNAMAEINDSSSNISKIIKVIDEIAFQTNILALNAAVEAARAGQHGKGFAVVAEEVRNLAARSANAAKETTEMIENSIKKVETGTQIANSTAEALNRIVDGVAKAAALVGDIASASNEQATGIAQINQAIAQVAQVIQTNSATAEESASSSEELSSQADLLKSAVSQFKLKKVRGNAGFEGGLNPEVIRMIEEIVDKKKSHGHLEHLIGSVAEAAAARENASKARISLEDNDYGKY